MKLYVFRPRGFGPKSFFVLAESKEDAFKCVDEYIKKLIGCEVDCEHLVKGWGTNHYTLEEYDFGKVAENDNC